MGTKKAESGVWSNSVGPPCVTLGKGPTLSGPRWLSGRYSSLSLLGSPSLSPLASKRSGPPALRLPLPAPEDAPPPLPGRRVEEAGKAGKGGRGRSYRNRPGPGRLLNWGAWPNRPPQASASTSPPSLLALHCKHSSPTSVAAAPEEGTAADTARGRQKHLTPSVLPGGGLGRERGAGWSPACPGSEWAGQVNGWQPWLAPGYQPSSTGCLQSWIHSADVSRAPLGHWTSVIRE